MVAMENFEKCTVAMLGGPCMQHVTGNTSRLNHPQSAIICDSIFQTELKHSSHYQMWKKNEFAITLITTKRPTLQHRHNERDGVSNQQHLDGLLNSLFGYCGVS